MSRIGKQPIELGEKVTCAVAAGLVTIKGPLGAVSRPLDDRLKLEIGDKAVVIRPTKLTLDTNALWGTYASHLRNMVLGVTQGFQKQLIIEGVGYKANLVGNKLVFALGFSHPIELSVPEGIKVTVDKNNLTISGIDKELVGSLAAKIRDYKPPEPYKGKGIRYATETLRRKVGKRVTA